MPTPSSSAPVSTGEFGTRRRNEAVARISRTEARRRGQVAEYHDPAQVAAGPLTLTTGLASIVVGGHRSGASASAVLRCHLDRVFGGH